MMRVCLREAVFAYVSVRQSTTNLREHVEAVAAELPAYAEALLARMAAVESAVEELDATMRIAVAPKRKSAARARSMRAVAA